MRRKLFDTNNYISIHKIFSWGILKSYQTTISISIFEGLKVCSRCSRLTAENHCFSRKLNGPRANTRKQKNHHGSGRIRMNPMLNSFFPQPPATTPSHTPSYIFYISTSSKWRAVHSSLTTGLGLSGSVQYIFSVCSGGHCSASSPSSGSVSKRAWPLRLCQVVVSSTRQHWTNFACSADSGQQQ